MPDIANTAVHGLVEDDHDSSCEHWNGARRILKYLKYTQMKNFCSLKRQVLDLEMHANAEYASEEGRRLSVSGGLLSICSMCCV